MFEFANRLFKKEVPSSKNVAKERLRLVLVHDRANVSPHMLKSLKEDLYRVISEYMEIDQHRLEVNLEQDDDSVALVANIPVIKMKRDYAASVN